ncbi:MAG: hypothetical protein HQL95_12785 [Magnetococcales bacterium]|nr:hypothetical protein [Magnetococcales bacterium]
MVAAIQVSAGNLLKKSGGSGGFLPQSFDFMLLTLSFDVGAPYKKDFFTPRVKKSCVQPWEPSICRLNEKRTAPLAQKQAAGGGWRGAPRA